MSEREKSEDRTEKVNSILKKYLSKENLKQGGKKTIKSVAAGLLGAGAGVVIGKPSLLTGLALTAVGHIIGQPQIATFGVGMMATGGQRAAGGLAGEGANGLEGAKERIKNFGSNVLDNLYVGKFFKPKDKNNDSLKGTQTEKVQYFKYPENKELDMSGLDAIEAEINRSGVVYQEAEKKRAAVVKDDYSGVEEKLY